jgi:hypothetical protein
MKATFALSFVGVLVGACGSVNALPAVADAPMLDAASITCAAPIAPVNGGVTVSNGGLYPSTAVYTCDAGYGPSSSTTSTCGTDGSWAGSPPVCFSGAGGGAWHYRRLVQITGSSAGVQNGYVVPVRVDTASLIADGKMQATGADIRFATASGTELPWWVGDGMNTSSTRLWVKVDQIPFAGTTIHLDYGNPSAGLGGPCANNGRRTFELFDDFEASALDSARWSVGQQDRLPDQQDGLLHFYESTSQNGQYDGEEVQTVLTFAGSKIAEFNMRMSTAPESTWKSQMFLARIGSAATVSAASVARIASGWWSNGVQDCAAMNGSYLGKVQIDANDGTFNLFLGETLCASKSISELTTPYVFNFAVQGGWGSTAVDFSDFRVRSFVLPEPVAGTPGVEQGT